MSGWRYPRAIATIAVVVTIYVLVGATLARLVEPDTFTSFGLACWWAADDDHDGRLRRCRPRGHSRPDRRVRADAVGDAASSRW